MQLLLVEDDRITPHVQRELESWGHVVVATANGVEAWEHLQRQEFSLVISDWMMPQMDGLELVRRIRERPDSKYVYVILLTAKTETDDIVQGMDAGADDFLSKPFEHNELRVRVRAGERIIELERSLAERHAQLQAANRRMSRDLEAAAEVQRSLLPSTLPQLPGIQLAWSFRPCDELAGDFLNLFMLDDKHLALYVADVSGHGVVASLLSVTISRVLSAPPSASTILTRENESKQVEIVPPVSVMRELNRRFQMDDSGGSYFTLVYGILDVETMRFQYASAGHPPILHSSRHATPQFLSGEGYAIGWDRNLDFHQHELELSAGDRLLLYSDGVTEAMNEQLETFGDQQLVAALAALRSQSLQPASRLTATGSRTLVW